MRLAKSGESKSVARKPRADAERNRTQLLEAAKAAFADVGPLVTLDEIAKRAGVGIGTLYRHFPTRDALVESVYRREVEQMAAAAERLAGAHAPIEALRAWMRLFIDYVATKKIIVQALNSLTGGTSELFEASGALIKGAMADLLGRAVADGSVRADVDSLDLLHALVGFANINREPGWELRMRRLIDILIAGLRQ